MTIVLTNIAGVCASGAPPICQVNERPRLVRGLL